MFLKGGDLGSLDNHVFNIMKSDDAKLIVVSNFSEAFEGQGS